MDSNLDQRVVTAGLVGAVGFFGLCFYLMSRRERKEYHHVATVSKLFLHPVKSLAGIEVQEGHVTKRGFKSNGMYDRCFMVVDEDNYYMSAKQVPKMILIRTSFSEDRKNLILSADGKPDISVPLKQEGELIHSKIYSMRCSGIHCGDEVATWLSEFLGGTYRLIYCSEELPGKKLHENPLVGHLMRKNEATLFQDISHFTLLSEASLADLNTRLEEPVTVKNFRPTIYVNDCSAYAEDFWKYVKVGFEGAELRFTFHALRCKFITLDQETGTYHSDEPMKTLKGYRQCYDFAAHRKIYGKIPIIANFMNTETDGVIRVGDPIFASLQYQEHIKE